MPKVLEHLLLTTTEDPFNLKAWSGIPFSLRAALERQIPRLSVYTPPPPSRNPIDAVRRLVQGAVNYPLWMTRATLRQNARHLKAEIARLQPDAVLSISSQMVAFLDPLPVPTFLFSDAPYLAFSEAYAQWETFPVDINRFGVDEAAAGRRLDGLCFGSQWACDRARSLYNLPSTETLHVTPLGANWVPASTREQIFAQIDNRLASLAGGQIELLYLGKDWERKGGPLAVEVARHLRAAGLNVTLHVVGCRPELGADAAPGGFVQIHGLLYQSAPEQSARLAGLFERSHFLIVPTLAECFGIVFAEAQAFGLPPISRSVHAVPSVIRDTETGLLFDPSAPAEEYAAKIRALAADPARYRTMAQRARIWFEQTLAWDRTAEHVLTAVRTRLAR